MYKPTESAFPEDLISAYTRVSVVLKEYPIPIPNSLLIGLMLAVFITLQF